MQLQSALKSNGVSECGTNFSNQCLLSTSRQITLDNSEIFCGNLTAEDNFFTKYLTNQKVLNNFLFVTDLNYH